MAKFWRPLKKRMLFQGFSIQQRLPLLICILLLSVVTTFGIISYISVQQAAEKSGRERLASLSNQIGNMLSQSAQSMLAASREAAAKMDIIQCTYPNPDTSLAVNVMEKLALDSQTVMVEVTDKSLQTLCRYEKDYLKGKLDFSHLKIRYKPDTARLGKIMRLGDSLYYPVIVRIRNNDIVNGYLIRWRILYNSPRSVQQLSQLMGADAQLYIGNNDNSVWTNMVRAVPNPLPATAQKKKELYEYETDSGDKLLATVNQVGQSPWLVVISLSENIIMQPARNFLKWVIIIGVILIILGIFFAWLMSRNITRPLNELTVAASSIANGNYDLVVPVERRDEVGKLSRAYNAMVKQVSRARLELEKKIQETQQVNERLRQLSAHLENIREEERKHIAREMHDELGQFLTGLKMDIKWIEKKLPESKDNAATREKLTEMSKMVDDAVLFVRKLAAELRPSILDDLGLVAALEWHSQEFAKRFNIEVEFNSEVSDLATTPNIATGLFRMYQESLTNVARHASAKKVTAFLEVDEFIKLTIKDDGKGFDSSDIGDRKTLGLLGMRERAFMIGGKVDIISSPGEGTSIIIKIPLHKESSVLL
jgi:signal transduction histidine kinase